MKSHDYIDVRFIGGVANGEVRTIPIGVDRIAICKEFGPAVLDKPEDRRTNEYTLRRFHYGSFAIECMALSTMSNNQVFDILNERIDADGLPY